MTLTFRECSSALCKCLYLKGQEEMGKKDGKLDAKKKKGLSYGPYRVF